MIQIALADVDLFNSPTGKLVPVCTLKCVHPKVEMRRRFIRAYDLVEYEGMLMEQQQRNTMRPKFVVNMIGASAPNDYLVIDLTSGSRGI